MFYCVPFARTDSRLQRLGGGVRPAGDVSPRETPVVDLAHVETTLARLRQAGATVASLEVAEPELEQVFVKIMRREESRALP